MEEKIFKTHNQQLKILRERGLHVPTTGSPKRILERENYYTIINGYKELFIDSPKTDTTEEQYKSGSKFKEIYTLYQFDCELKSIFLKRILRVENNIKSSIAYVFSQKHGHDNYLKAANFETSGKIQNLQDVVYLIQKIQGNIAKNINKHGSIKHYMTKHGYVPLWVLMNILTLGTVSNFYTLMKQPERQAISKIYNISDAEMGKILGVLTLCRNICAHDERLYNFNSPRISIQNNPIHAKLCIPIGANGPINGKNDLFSILISLKILLNNTDFNKMVSEIKKNLNQLDKELETISITDIFNKMGFPFNWDKL